MSKMLLTDLYMLTMGQGYFDAGKKDDIGYFELFFRKLPQDTGYAIASGLRNVIKYVEDFGFTQEDIKYLKGLGFFSDAFLQYLGDMKFECDISAVPDGTIIFPYQPILTVRGPIIQAQLFEAAFLMYINHSSTIATKSARVCHAARGRSVTEQGQRSKHGETAAIEAAADAFIAGCAGTSCVEAGKKYGIPLYGTMAHSFIKSFDSEAHAFEAYYKSFPETAAFLVDSFDTLKSGMPSAIKVANGRNLNAVRLDSGDFENLSKQVRVMLDDAGMRKTKIIVSGSLDEYKIDKLMISNAPIDVFGVGENMTGSIGYGLGMVYKLCAIEHHGSIIPKMKISENGEKVSLPGIKKLHRVFDKRGLMVRDFVALETEKVQGEIIATQIFKKGKLVYKTPSIIGTREYCTKQKASLPVEYKKIINPSTYRVEFSDGIQKLKEGIMKKHVLVVIDMVNGFVKFGALSSSLVDTITPKIVDIIRDFLGSGKKVIALRDCHEKNDAEFAVYPPHCVKGTAEVELVPEIKLFEKDITVLDKNVTDGLAMNHIKEYFSENIFDTVTVVGCCTDICVQQFACGLKKMYDEMGRKTDIIVPKTAVATFDAPGHNAKDAHKKALAVMQSAGIKIL